MKGMKEVNLGFSQTIIIPMGNKCPGCSKPKDLAGQLVHHHFVDLSPNIFYAYEICQSCNSVLGHKYQGNYPTWEEQLKYLNHYWKNYWEYYQEDYWKYFWKKEP